MRHVVQVLVLCIISLIVFASVLTGILLATRKELEVQRNNAFTANETKADPQQKEMPESPRAPPPRKARYVREVRRKRVGMAPISDLRVVTADEKTRKLTPDEKRVIAEFQSGQRPTRIRTVHDHMYLVNKYGKKALVVAKENAAVGGAAAAAALALGGIGLAASRYQGGSPQDETPTPEPPKPEPVVPKPDENVEKEKEKEKQKVQDVNVDLNASGGDDKPQTTTTGSTGNIPNAPGPPPAPIPIAPGAPGAPGLFTAPKMSKEAQEALDDAFVLFGGKIVQFGKKKKKQKDEEKPAEKTLVKVVRVRDANGPITFAEARKILKTVTTLNNLSKAMGTTSASQPSLKAIADSENATVKALFNKTKGGALGTARSTKAMNIVKTLSKLCTKRGVLCGSKESWKQFGDSLAVTVQIGAHDKTLKRLKAEDARKLRKKEIDKLPDRGEYYYGGQDVDMNMMFMGARVFGGGMDELAIRNWAKLALALKASGKKFAEICQAMLCIESNPVRKALIGQSSEAIKKNIQRKAKLALDELPEGSPFREKVNARIEESALDATVARLVESGLGNVERAGTYYNKVHPEFKAWAEALISDPNPPFDPESDENNLNDTYQKLLGLKAPDTENGDLPAMAEAYAMRILGVAPAKFTGINCFLLPVVFQRPNLFVRGSVDELVGPKQTIADGLLNLGFDTVNLWETPEMDNIQNILKNIMFLNATSGHIDEHTLPYEAKAVYQASITLARKAPGMLTVTTTETEEVTTITLDMDVLVPAEWRA